MSFPSFLSKKQPEATSVADVLAGTMSHTPTKSKSRRSDVHNADSEQLIPEKKRARRRLIGAIAMVLAVVIGLPMVLDSEPKSLNKNIVIQIPSKDASADLSGLNDAELKDERVHVGSIEQEAQIASSSSIAQTTSESKSEAVPTRLKPVAADVIAKKEVPAHPAEPETKPVNSALANVGESARASAILNGVDSSASDKAARIVVQVGAFATQEKVSKLQGKLTSIGIKSFTQKVATSSGDKIRVRIGPFTDKESADKVKIQLEKSGLNGTVISL